MKTIIMEFQGKIQFRLWLSKHHDKHPGIDLYLYKKGYENLGLTYEDAVRTALCYGWIDAVTHRCDEKRFRQYFSRRKKNSSWSISNIIRMQELIATDEMTTHGLELFDITLLDQLPKLIEQEQAMKESPPIIPTFFLTLLLDSNSLEVFQAKSNTVQNQFLHHILDGKKEETKIRRCKKIIVNLQNKHENP